MTSFVGGKYDLFTVGDAPYLLLDVVFEFHAPSPAGWWRDEPSLLPGLLGAARDQDLWLGFRWLSRPGGKVEVGSVDEVIAGTAMWTDDRYALHSSPGGEAGTSSLALTLRGALLLIKLTVGAADVAAGRHTLIDRLVAFIADVRGRIGDRGWLGDRGHVRVMNVEEPRVRPPREHRAIATSGMVVFVDPHYLVHHGLADDLARLRTAALPTGVSREEHGRLIVLRWIDEPLDERTIAAALARNEVWRVRTLDLPVLDGWNPLGDQEVFGGVDLAPHPRLTLYSPANRIGYKTLAAAGAHDAPGQAIDEIAGWIREGKLPDGTPLRGVNVILPSREAAIALRDRLRELGVWKVLYTDNDARLWDPFPPGNWIES